MLAVVVTMIIVLIAAVAVGLIVAANQPSEFTVSRRATVEAPPERVFALIHDFNAWRSWSPYETKDPTMQRIVSGAPSGTGAVYEWEGNRQVGKGRIEITDACHPSRVAIKMDMLKPVAASHVVNFTLEPVDAGTHVTWAITGCNAYVAKVMGLVMDMDKMIGKEFEIGLANLKSLAETKPLTADALPNEREVRITRLVDAPRETVWTMWTDPQHLARWWGPHGFTAPVCEVDARPGGALRIVMRAPDGIEYPMIGTFQEIVRPERIVFNATPQDQSGNALLKVLTTVTFTERDGATEVTVHASGVALAPVAAQMLAGMQQGWSESLERLAELSIVG